MIGSRHLREAVSQHVKTKYGINDDRLQLIDDSFGYLMYRRSGLEEGDDLANPDSTVHGAFRDLYNQKLHGEDITPDTDTAMSEAIDKLREDLLSIINIVVTTTTNAADFKIHTNFHPVFVIADEMGRVSEMGLWPLFAYYSANILLLGDVKQTHPMVSSTLETNGFADLLGLSVLQRLVLAGAPMVKLYQQYRFSEDTLRLINNVFYNDSIIMHPSVMERPGIKEGQDFIEKTYGRKGRNAIMLNLPNSKCKQLGSSPSKFNPLEVFHIITTVEQMVDFGIPAKDIGVAVPYTAQKTIICRGVAWLKSRRSDIDLEGIEVLSIDGFQGRERRFMIVGLTVTNKIGFLSEGYRVNVAITRNKDCLVCIANVAQMERSKGWSKHALAKVVNNFKRLLAVVTIKDSAVPDEFKTIMPLPEQGRDEA